VSRNVVGSRFEKLILLSYEFAGEAWRRMAAWNEVSERAQPSGREKLQSLRR